MNEPARQQFTFRDYLDLEEHSGVKHEFLDGHVWAMAGGTPDHTGIAMSIGALLSAQLRGKPCRVFGSDLRVRVVATGLSTYPDISVICGQFESDPADPRGNTATNPIVIVEVLSPSTERYDRGEKLTHYKKIASLRQIALVAHDTHRVEVWTRNDKGEWIDTVTTKDGTAHLTSIACDLPLIDIYRDPLAS